MGNTNDSTRPPAGKPTVRKSHATTPSYPSALKALGFILLVGSVTLVSCQAALTSF